MEHAAAPLDATLSGKTKRVIASLRSRSGKVLVALSGGVDSAVLLALSREALGCSRVLAATGSSAAVTTGEIRDAATVANRLGISHVVVETNELQRPGYRLNEGDRCFHCRTELFELLAGVANEHGCEAIAYGAIIDDLADDRPGMQAAQRHGVLAPLLDAGICKSDVRELAKQLALHISDKPANACLASRIPKGTEVTVERLHQVEHAESALRAFGFSRVRVRHHGEVARIEVSRDELGRFADEGIRRQVVAAVQGAGFRFATVDLAGYREAGAGSGNDSKLYSIAPHPDGGQ